MEVEKSLMTLQTLSQDTFSDTRKYHKFARKILGIKMLSLIAISLSLITINHFNIILNPKISQLFYPIFSLINLIIFVVLTVDNNFGKKDSRKYFILGFSFLFEISFVLLFFNDIKILNEIFLQLDNPQSKSFSRILNLILKYIKNMILMKTIFYFVAFLFTLQTMYKLNNYHIYVLELIIALLSYFLFKYISPGTISPFGAIVAVLLFFFSIFLINLLAKKGKTLGMTPKDYIWAFNHLSFFGLTLLFGRCCCRRNRTKN